MSKLTHRHVRRGGTKTRLGMLTNRREDAGWHGNVPFSCNIVFFLFFLSSEATVARLCLLHCFFLFCVYFKTTHFNNRGHHNLGNSLLSA